MTVKPTKKVLILIGLAGLGFFIYGILDTYNLLSTIQDGKVIQRFIESTGIFGPVMIIMMMTLAILVSPLPSAPIAIAAGALYGHIWGTLYVLTGSLCGATGAFFVSRYLGYEYVQKLTKDYFPPKFLDSQNALMGIVFATRLMPFISFDVMSYAAGLTSLLLWRFVVATLLGIVPSSFFLAHVGSEVATAELNRIAVAVLLLTMLTGISFLIRIFRNKTLKKKL